jgi:hypothetical protein
LSEGSDSRPPFFAVGLRKFVALSIATFCLYHLVWMYQHWRHRRDVAGERVLPAARALFAWIFAVPLGYRIAKAGVARGTAGWLPGIVAALLWASATVGMNALPDGPWSLAAMLVIAPAAWLQALANSVNAAVAPSADPNREFTTMNMVTIALGAVLFLLALAGLFVPTETINVEETF